MNGPSEWIKVGMARDFSGAGPYAVTAGDTSLVLVRAEGVLRALDAHCPREQTPRASSYAVQTVGDSVLVNLQAKQAAEAKPVALRQIADLPGPRGLPFVGNALQLSAERVHLDIERWARTYGTPFVYRLGNKPSIVLGDAPRLHEVLRARPHAFRRQGALDVVLREAGVEGLFTAEGTAWRPQRRLAMEALSNRYLRGIYPTVRMMVERLFERLRRAAAAGESLVLRDEFARFTTDITTAVVFGHDGNALEDHDDAVQRDGATVFATISERIFAAVPYWRVLRLPSDRRFDAARERLNQWADGLIEATRTRLADHPRLDDEPSNLLEAMIIAKSDDGRPYTNDEIRSNAVTFLLGGADPIASALAWAVHELCDYPQGAARLAEEATRVLGEQNVPDAIDGSAELAYAGAVAQETMRLRPTVSIMLVEALDDVVVGDLAVPRGTTLSVLPRLPGTGEQSFGQGQAFIPERWLGERADLPHDASASLPFGAGPRICPGRSLAMLLTRLVLAMLYKHFTVQRVGERDAVTERLTFTMGPENLRVRLTAAGYVH